MSKIVNLGINVDVFQLVKSVVNVTQNTSFNEKWYDNNKGRWISCQVGGYLISANFHSTQQHSATVIGSSQCKSTAPPGKWAVAFTNNSMFGGNKTSYDFGSHLL